MDADFYGIVVVLQIGMVLFEVRWEMMHPDIPYVPHIVRDHLVMYCEVWFVALPLMACGTALVLFNKFKTAGWHSPILNIVGRLILLTILFFLVCTTLAVWG